MAATIEVMVRRAGAPATLEVGDAPLRVGRSPSNDVVVAAPRVSWHHAALWCEAGGLWVRDDGSRNGVRVGDAVIARPTRLSAGDEVWLSDVRVLRVVAVPEGASPPVVVRDVEAGVVLAVRGALRIGSGPGADLRVPDGDVVVHVDDGQAWLEGPVGAHDLVMGIPFAVGGRAFVVERAAVRHVPTTEVVPDAFPIRVSTTLNGVTGPEAQLTDIDGGAEPLLISADNGAVLLHMLVERWLADRSAGRSARDTGWRKDDELKYGIWGRRADLDPNALHVVIYRLRKLFEERGYDPRCIEKRRRSTRLRVVEAASR